MAAAYLPQAELLRIVLIAGGAVGAGSSWQDLRETLMAMQTPETLARVKIDAALAAAGWCVQDARTTNLHAGTGVAVREFPLPGFVEADYLLFAGGQAVGAVEAKKEGTTLTGVETQAAKYGAGLPAHLPAPVRPLPFLYESTGVETRFTERLDPDPRSRRVFAFHRPETASPDNPTGRWRPYALDELLARDKASLDLFWLKDDALADSSTLADPDLIAAEIVEDLRATLEQFELIQGGLVEATMEA